MAKGIAPAAAIAAWIVAAATLLGARTASAASLVEIIGFGQNPTNLRMHVYAPDVLLSPPPILVAIHYCTGSGPTFFNGTEFRTLADQYGFIVIYPSATRSGQCFDVSSPQALRRNGGSDPVGIMSMVTYVIQSYGANANRVYVTGASSGAMMTNVMLGNYPDVFKAGAAFMGVPHSLLRNHRRFDVEFPMRERPAHHDGTAMGRSRARGDSRLLGSTVTHATLHGTNDTTLRYPNFGEEIKQWTNVLGRIQTPSSTDMPQSGWTRTRYGGTGVGAPVEAISLNGAGHDLPLAGQAPMAIQFFGLDTGAPGPDTQAPSVPANLTSPTQTGSSISLGMECIDRQRGSDRLSSAASAGREWWHVHANRHGDVQPPSSTRDWRRARHSAIRYAPLTRRAMHRPCRTRSPRRPRPAVTGRSRRARLRT